MIIMGVHQFLQISYYFHPGYQPQWLHSWETNNHEIVIDRLNRTIQGFGLTKNRIAIIENPGFAGDPVKLLSLYFLAADKKMKSA